MCEPATITAATGWLSANAGWISLATGAASTVVNAQAARSQAAYTQRVAQNNEVEAKNAAARATEKGEKDAMVVRRQAQQAKGGQRAALAARGLDLNSGTAEQLQAQTDFFGQLDQDTVRENARGTAKGYESQASNFSAQAKNAKPGEAGFVSLLSGASSVADKWHSFAEA